ncbi:MAG: hypothetical protein JST50_10365 [Bacteroidetes bacterium]|jgi:hypothetical protein|nr:hypothetical protein [Bacteroidota bacterium]
MKPEHPHHKTKLRSTADRNKENILYIFSDAHLDDLKPSKEIYRDIDLEFMGKYVQDNYFSVDTKLEFQCYLANPKTAFDGKNYKAIDELYNNPQYLDDIFNAFGDLPGMDTLKAGLNAFWSQPLGNLKPMLDPQKMDEENRAWLLKFLPDYSPDMTLRDFWSNNLQFSKKFLEDKKELRDLRKYIAKTMNRDSYSWDKWKNGFNEKFCETPLKKTFLQMIDGMLLNDQKQHIYRNITYAYALLELYNITEERNSTGPKKFTFSSLNKDAQHVFYASFCDYLVTDDRGMQLKAFIVYNLFKIPTQVLSVEDFINRNYHIQNNEETYDTFMKTLAHDIDHALQLFSKPDLMTDKKIDTYKTNHVYFNYFNRMQLITGDGDKRCVLYCERNSHGNFFLFREIKIITTKLLTVFGLDDDMRGEYNMDEKGREPYVRKWSQNDAIFYLVVTSNVNGNYIALSLEL